MGTEVKSESRADCALECSQSFYSAGPLCYRELANFRLPAKTIDVRNNPKWSEQHTIRAALNMQATLVERFPEREGSKCANPCASRPREQLPRRAGDSR